MARPLTVPHPALLTLVCVGWFACSTPTATTLAQTGDGTTRSLPRTGDVLEVAPDNVEGEAVLDIPGATGQPQLRIVTGSVKLDLVSQSVGFVVGPPSWAEVVVRFSITPKSPLRGTLNSANGIATPAAFDSPGFPDQNSRVGFSVKALTVEQLPSGEVVVFVRVAVRGLVDTKLMRIAYQINLLWTPGATPNGQPATPPAAPTPPAPPPK